MDICYYTYTLDTIHNTDFFNEIIDLHKTIFGTTDHLAEKISNKNKLLVIIAVSDMRVVGYKMGYEISSYKFYSWLGGVDANFRKRGIASMLMRKQHQYLKEAGYSIIQTKTMNKWRSMLLLNIKSGFDVIDTYTDTEGIQKIVLEKKLLH